MRQPPPMPRAKLAFGYSLGEASALIAAGVFEMKHLLRVPLALADDCVALADGVTMGVLFSRGPAFDFDAVERTQHRLNRRERIKAVKLIEVEMIGLETA